VIEGGRYSSRNTVPEHPPTSAPDRPQRGRQRHNLGHSRDAGAPVHVAGEPTGRVTTVAQP